MSFLNSASVKAAISAAVLGLAATCASAAQVTIKLPVQAQWGRTLLSPGQYVLTMDQGASEMHISGNGKNVSVLVATSDRADAATSHVNIVNVNGTSVIQEVSLASLGKKYTFLTPRATGAAGKTMAFTMRDQAAKH